MSKEIELQVVAPVDPKNPTHYVDNKKFYQALVEYREAVDEALVEGKERPIVPNYIGECFLKIARGIAMKHNFRNYSYINDMISSGVEVCLKHVMSFNPEKSQNPFSYFTQAIWFAFLNIIEKENRQVALRRRSFLNMDIDAFDLQLHDETGEFAISIADFINSLGPEKVKPVRSKKKKEGISLDNFFDSEEEVE